MLAKEAGNAVVEITTGWTKVREAVEMRDPLTVSLRSKIREIAGLREWTHTGTPHNRADEGFIDDVEKVSLSFPIIRSERSFPYWSLFCIPVGLVVIVLGLMIAAMLHFHIW